MARKTVPLEEPSPERDRVEGLAHPRETLELVGHEAAEASLIAALRTGMPHGWIFAGPRGVGKATLAYRLARALLARPPGEGPPETLDVPQGHPVARHVAALTHPDLVAIRRQWDARTKRFPAVLQVDEVRRLHGFFAKTAGRGGWRIAIVDAADEMNVNAANALLKILEEPPANALILLVAHAPGSLLPTIRSRARMLRLMPLDDEAMRRVLATHGAVVSGTEEARLLALAAGSPGEALRLLNEGSLELLARIDEGIGALPGLADSVHALAGATAARGAESQFATAMALTMRRLQEAIAAVAAGRGAGPPFPRGLLTPATLDVWIEVWETQARLARAVSSLNLDRGASLVTAFELMAAAARGTRPGLFAGEQFRDI